MPSPAKNKAYKKAQTSRAPTKAAATSTAKRASSITPLPGLVEATDKIRGTKYCCCGCGECFDLPDNNFIKSSSPLFYGWGGFVPICKKCAEIFYRERVLPAFEMDERRAMEHMCRMFDWFWSDETFEDAVLHRDKLVTKGSNTNLINTYAMKRMMRQKLLKGQTYIETIKQQAKKGQSTISGEVTALEIPQTQRQDDTLDQSLESLNSADEPQLPIVNPDDIYFFGPGYTPDQYKYLRDQYEDWAQRYDAQTKAQEEIFKGLCIAQLNVQCAQAEGDQKRTTDAMKTLQDLMDSARIKPKQKASDALVEQNTFGTLIKMWENEQPIPEPRPEWRDVDGIGKSLTVWFYGHLAKMFHLENDAASAYEEEVSKYTVRPPRYIEGGDGDATFREKFNAMRGKKTDDEGDERGGP